MSVLRQSLPTGRALAALDILLAIWVVAWIWLGISVGQQVSGLRNLSTTAERAGSASHESGRVLGKLGSLPLVGGDVGKAARQVEVAGASAVASARMSRASVGQLSWMLALAIALIPSTPVIGLYLPLRVGRVRERRTVRRLWSASSEDPQLRRLLAERALATLPYHALAREDRVALWRDRGSEQQALIEAELARVGLSDLRTAMLDDGAPGQRRGS